MCPLLPFEPEPKLCFCVVELVEGVPVLSFEGIAFYVRFNPDYVAGRGSIVFSSSASAEGFPGLAGDFTI
jgi:hypothetical protein